MCRLASRFTLLSDKYSMYEIITAETMYWKTNMNCKYVKKVLFHFSQITNVTISFNMEKLKTNEMF
jgi:hypothetical protein